MAADATLDDDALWDDAQLQSAFVRAGRDAGTQEAVLAIDGLLCAGCGVAVERACLLSGVDAAEVNAATERLLLRWRPGVVRLSAIVAAARRAGYALMPVRSLALERARTLARRRALWRFAVAAFCMMQVMMYAGAGYTEGAAGIEPGIRRLLHWAAWLMTLPVLVFCSAEFAAGAWRDLKARRVGPDVPVLLGIVAAFVGSSGAAFDPGGVFGDVAYFDSLTMFVCLLLGARWLQARTAERAQQALEKLLRRLPEAATVETPDGARRRVPLARLAAGDVIVVAAGDVFPADGALLSGTTLVDESLLSGEALPLERCAGDEVVAGSLNLGAEVRLHARRVGADTRHAGIEALVDRALAERPAAPELAGRWAAPFTLGVLLLAAASALGWAFVDPSRSLWVAVTVLIVTCPCALALAAPAAQLAASAELARHGVLLRRPQALERLARVDHVMFDKTGTLTEGRLALDAVDPPEADGALALAAALAAHSHHPLARALREAAGGVAPPADAPWPLAEHAGRGIEGRDAAGRGWWLGAPEGPGRAGSDDDAARTRAVLTCDGRELARFTFAERIRPDAAAALRELRALKATGGRTIGLTLASGDTPRAAAAIATRLGIETTIAGATPEAKLAELRRLQQQGAVVLAVGDGINDAPLLGGADVSAALGDGAPAAHAGADLALLGAPLSALPATLVLARRAQAALRQNVRWAVAYNVACLPLAAAGWLPPWLAGLGMAGSSLAVVGNALRLARLPRERHGIQGPSVPGTSVAAWIPPQRAPRAG